MRRVVAVFTQYASRCGSVYSVCLSKFAQIFLMTTVLGTLQLETCKVSLSKVCGGTSVLFMKHAKEFEGLQQGA